MHSGDTSAARSDALLRTVHLLLESLRLHAIEGEQCDYEKFQIDVHALETRLGEAPTPADVLLIAGTAVKIVEEYNRDTSRFLKQQSIEYQGMLGMLTETVASISKGSESTVLRLHDLEK